MITGIFLIVLTLTSTLTVKREQFPALIYLLFAFLTYFISLTMESNLHIFKMAAISEMCLVSVLFCMRGCLNSELVRWLIPISILMIPVHFFGWNLEYTGRPLDVYNTLVYLYWGVIMGLFLVVGRMDGNRGWNIRFLRDANRKHNSLVKVHERC